MGADATGEFLLVTDIHFNPFADESIVDELVAADVSQWEAIFSSSDSGYAAYGEDGNYALMESALEDMSAHAGEVDFILYGGDVLGHNFEENYQTVTGDMSTEGYEAFVAKTFEFVLERFEAYFPDDAVYLTLGNTDAYAGDYAITPGGEFLSDSTEMLAEYCLDSAENIASLEATYPSAGYYAVRPAETEGVTLIVLNGVLWHRKYAVSTEAGLQQLAWYQSQLEQAAQNNEKVWVLTHMPVGVDAYKTVNGLEATGEADAVLIMKEEYNNAFIALETVYSDTIAASFAGHIHRDDFRFFLDESTGLPYDVMDVAPSIAPVFGNNPGYQIVTYDTQTNELVDYTTWSMDLDDASAGWSEEYVFSETYGTTLDGPEQLAALYASLAADPVAEAAYAEYYDVSLEANNQITSENFTAYWLVLGHLTAESYNQAYNDLTVSESAAVLETSYDFGAAGEAALAAA